MDRMTLITALLADVLGEIYDDLPAGYLRGVARKTVATCYTTARETCEAETARVVLLSDWKHP